MSLFKRDWKLIDKTIMPSAHEQLMSTPNLKSAEHEYIPLGFYRKKVVYIFQCQITKKIKKVEATNP